jgi:hypothetical protein
MLHHDLIFEYTKRERDNLGFGNPGAPSTSNPSISRARKPSLRFADTNITHVTLLPALLLTRTGDSSAGTAAHSPASTAPPPATATPPPAAGTAHYFAYVTNQNDVSVFSINADTGALTPVGAHIAAGTYPNAISVHANGKFAYVPNGGSNDISAYSIKAATGALTSIGAPVAAGTDPFSITVHRGGKFAYVANYTSRDVWVYTIRHRCLDLHGRGRVGLEQQVCHRGPERQFAT